MHKALPKPIREVLADEHVDYSETTVRVYRAAWRDLLQWWARSLGKEDLDIESLLKDQGQPLPSFEAIAGYLDDRSDLAWSTLTNRRQAIRHVYEAIGAKDPFEQPVVEKAWRGIRRVKREQSEPDPNPKPSPSEVIEKSLDLLRSRSDKPRADDEQEESTLYELMREDFRYLPHHTVRTDDMDPDQKKLIPDPAYDLKVLRNRTLLLLVAASDATRAQLTGISLEDVHLRLDDENEPIWVVLRDDEARPESVLRLETAPELKLCPARSLASWLVAAEIEEGPIFRSFTPHGKPKTKAIRPQSINHVIRKRAEAADGLNPSDWSTRSLRSS